MIETIVFLIAGAICIAGALGVVLSTNAVHAALSLVGTLFGIAVLFVAQEAHFLAAVQVIVYAGAIVVLFLFVIMLLGVDRTEKIDIGGLAGQRPAAAVFGLGMVGLIVLLAVAVGDGITGVYSTAGTAIETSTYNITQLARSLFGRYVYVFELTSVLLVIAVIAAVVLARRPGSEARDQQEEVGG